jgi:parvulin-like peptidyl-prolyl isomerase
MNVINKNVITKKAILTAVSTLFLLPVCLVAQGNVAPASPSTADDVIAMVGDQPISFSEINTVLNSSAIVGVSVPAIGTPGRDTARITLLDKFVSANLIYLDALKQGVGKDARYQQAINRFSNAILAGLYRRYSQAAEITVSEEEIQAYYKKNVAAGTELNDDLHLQIESQLHRQKLHARLATAEKTLRDDVKVTVYEKNLDRNGDKNRDNSTPLAQFTIDGAADKIGEDTILWGQVKDKIISSGNGATAIDPLAFEDTARRDALENEIDLRIMAQKARAMELDKNPVYTKRITEYRKSLLTNMHREQLTTQMQPTEMELEAYYVSNRKRFAIPEARKVQMVVVKNKADADSIKAKIDAGEITMYQAAQDYSIAANAKQNLGEAGWLNRGEMAPALDQAIFTLEPGAISEPVESPAGWHILTVLEVKDARFTDFADKATHKLTLRSYLEEKLDAYTVELRNKQFQVQVYQDRLVKLAQQEANMVKELADKSEKPGSVTKKRIEEMNKLMMRPPS